MATLEQLFDQYMDSAVGPADMQKLALLQLSNASVQDDAVSKAAQNLQGVEKYNRSALENYLMAEEEAAKAESEKALQMAQQRLGSLDMNITTTLANPMGLNKEGKAQLAQMRAEREAILKKYPQLGNAEAAGIPEDSAEVDIVGSKDADVWKKFAKEATIEQIAQLYNDNMGQIPDALESMLTFRMKNSPELTKRLKTDPSLRPIAHLAGETLGDAQKAAQDAASASENARKKADEKKLLDGYKVDLEQALIAFDPLKGNKFAESKFLTGEFKKKMSALKNAGMLNGEQINKLKRKIGEF